MSQQVLDGVRDLLPTIRSRAEEAERLRVIPDASIKELEETGFYRLLQPKRYGGFKLSGRWSFSSGSDHCQWVLLGGLVFNDDGQVVDFRTFMIPRSDYTIEDVWNVIGLRGTGSNDIIVEDVFVPEAFTLSMSDTGRCFGPGQEVNTAELYKLPFHSVFTMTISTPLIGMAYGAYAEHVEMQRKRVRA